MNHPADWPCEPWAVDSSAAASISSQVLLCAEAVDDVAARMSVVTTLDWESPAGRNFSTYLALQVGGVRRAHEQLREAAARVAGFAAALRADEYRRFLEQQRP